VAEILSDQGKLEEARSLFESAHASWSAVGYKVGVAFAESNLGRLAGRAGDVASGRQLLARALAAFREINSPAFIAETELRLVECDVLEGNFEAAIAGATRLIQVVKDVPGYELVYVTALRFSAAAELLEARSPVAGDGQRDREGPMRVLDDAITRSSEMEALYELALGLDIRVALGPIAAGEKDRLRAEEIFSQLGVEQAVITWLDSASGGPLFAYQSARADT